MSGQWISNYRVLMCAEFGNRLLAPPTNLGVCGDQHGPEVVSLKAHGDCDVFCDQ